MREKEDVRHLGGAVQQHPPHFGSAFFGSPLIYIVQHNNHRNSSERYMLLDKLISFKH